MDVTFETKCWEKDYKLILETNHVKNMIENCNFKFKNRNIIINNINNRNLVQRDCENLIEKGAVNSCYFASDFEEEVLNYFDINKGSFNGGYYYSIAELVGIYLCNTKYLLHFSSDSYIPGEFKLSEWISEAIEIMESHNDIIVANPVWNYKYDEARDEAFSETENGKFYISYGFSDQCYLINTEVFKNKIYGYKHPASSRYPNYGGELFEKRVDSFMRTMNKKRIIAKEVSYISKNNKPWSYFFEKLNIKNISR